MAEDNSIRDVLNNLPWAQRLNDNSPVVIGTAQQSDEQMEAFDTFNDEHPSEVIRTKDGSVLSPNLAELISKLPRTPAIVEVKYTLDAIQRMDTGFTATATTATVLVPFVIPQGKTAFIDEVHIAQTSGAGSSPSGYITDANLAQLYGIIVPDGSTFGASYKSGRQIVPGGVQLLLSFANLLNGGTYLVSLQYKLRTRVDVPYVDLNSLFGGNSKDRTLTFDDGDEQGFDTGRTEYPGGPYDDAGFDVG